MSLYNAFSCPVQLVPVKAGDVGKGVGQEKTIGFGVNMASTADGHIDRSGRRFNQHTATLTLPDGACVVLACSQSFGTIVKDTKGGGPAVARAHHAPIHQRDIL